ncbi:hypothetical protein NG799_22945, partial [Laspinema sp. D1]|nr:hypothetical protein [Laspinema sp. D2a]
GIAKSIEVGQNADGRLEVFTIGTDSKVYQAWQTTPNGGWSNWQQLSGGIAKSVTVGRNQDGRLEVFAIGTDNKVYQAWQTTPNGSWSNWQPLLQSGSVSDLTVSQNQDGRLEAFAMGMSGQLQHAWQNQPNSSWIGWQSRNLPSPTTSTYSPPGQPGQSRQYVIKSGETLWGIAQRELGNGNRWREIMKTPTGGTFTDAEAKLLRVGQSVYLPVNYDVPGTVTPVTPTPNPSPVQNIILNRAKVWVDGQIPYNQGKYYQGYRQDCSGFVSMAWQLPVSAVTSTLPQYAITLQSKEQLQPGDAINNRGIGNGGHVVLFVRWVDKAKGTFIAYEENGYYGKALQTQLTLKTDTKGYYIQEYSGISKPWYLERKKS